MARTKGALNKRTRAALHAAETGELGGGGERPVDYLLRVMRDSGKADALRIEAAKAVAPYLAPKLSTTEIVTPDPFEGKSHDDMVAELKAILHRNSGTRLFVAELCKGDPQTLCLKNGQ